MKTIKTLCIILTITLSFNSFSQNETTQQFELQEDFPALVRLLMDCQEMFIACIDRLGANQICVDTYNKCKNAEIKENNTAYLSQEAFLEVSEDMSVFNQEQDIVENPYPNPVTGDYIYSRIDLTLNSNVKTFLISQSTNKICKRKDFYNLSGKSVVGLYIGGLPSGLYEFYVQVNSDKLQNFTISIE